MKIIDWVMESPEMIDLRKTFFEKLKKALFKDSIPAETDIEKLKEMIEKLLESKESQEKNSAETDTNSMHEILEIIENTLKQYPTIYEKVRGIIDSFKK